MPTYRIDPSRPGRLVCQDCGLAVAGLPRRPCSPGRGCPPHWADDIAPAGAEAAEPAPVPPRAALLYRLADLALACGVFSFFCGVPALFGLPLGVAVWAVAADDLARMRSGALGPEGRAHTAGAKWRAGSGAVFSLIGGLAVALIIMRTLRL